MFINSIKDKDEQNQSIKNLEEEKRKQQLVLEELSKRIEDYKVQI